MNSFFKLQAIAVLVIFVVSCNETPAPVTDGAVSPMDTILGNPETAPAEVVEPVELSPEEKATSELIESIPVAVQPFDVNSDHLGSEHLFLLVDETTFDLLGLKFIDDLEGQVEGAKYAVMRKAEYGENTGILIARNTGDESYIWLVLYNSSNKILDYVEVYYENSEGMMWTESRIQNDQISVTAGTFVEEGDVTETMIYTVTEKGEFLVKQGEKTGPTE